MSLHKEYVPYIDGQELKFTISFNKETANWATSQPKKIGYQVTVIPVKRTKHEGYIMEESGCFTGFNTCLLEVGRQSSKRLTEAIKVLQNRKQEFIDRFPKSIPEYH